MCFYFGFVVTEGGGNFKRSMDLGNQISSMLLYGLLELPCSRGKQCRNLTLTLKVLVATINAQWEGMGDVGSARYEPALLPPCPTTRVLSYSN